MNEVRMYNHKLVVKVELYNMIKMEFKIRENWL